MPHLRFQTVVQHLALLAWLVSGGPAQGFDGNTGPDSAPGSQSGPVTLIPLLADSTAPTTGDPGGETGAQSADSLFLMIESVPFAEDAPLGSGVSTTNDWLDDEGIEVDLQRIPASHDLLPDLFRETKQQADVSLQGTLLLDEDEEEITDRIDGAGVSIKYRTE